MKEQENINKKIELVAQKISIILQENNVIMEPKMTVTRAGVDLQIVLLPAPEQITENNGDKEVVN